jgi:hypothetical protein
MTLNPACRQFARQHHAARRFHNEPSGVASWHSKPARRRCVLPTKLSRGSVGEVGSQAVVTMSTCHSGITLTLRNFRLSSTLWAPKTALHVGKCSNVLQSWHAQLASLVAAAGRCVVSSNSSITGT